MSSQKHKETHVSDNTETFWKHFNIHKRKKKHNSHEPAFQKTQQSFRKLNILENTTTFHKTSVFSEMLCRSFLVVV